MRRKLPSERNIVTIGGEYEMQLEQRARLVVAIRSAQGAPVEGAEIELRRTNAAPRVLGRTDPAGRAVADGLPPGSYELRVTRYAGARTADERLVYLEDGGNLVSFALRGDRWLAWGDQP